MSRSVLRIAGLLSLAFLLSALIPTNLFAQESQSASLAKQLVALMDQDKLDSAAAKDQASNDGFIAALYFPGQLMVVSARYSVPMLLNQKLDKKEYRDIYIDLNSASVPKTKTLVMDLGADGLKAKRDEHKPFDTFETPARTWSFDGDWKAQKITEAEYMKAFSDAEAHYVKMLQALIAQLKKTS